MTTILGALLAVAVVTAALVATSLDRRTAALLGAAGSTTGNFLAWVVAPHAWAEVPLVPWVAAVAGTVASIALWSATRLYAGIFEPPRAARDDDTAALATVGPER
ncbi:hypothetical protein DEJ23_10360 [Curtobacterium sp. MCSS17_008]|uniref:hypothetical protein n=1 Tax=Curtobacterium sp. MCSS17_008 TaxID=2175647 RepID=UPI000DA92238|nr:hypothetical protein [Curtobacterium sp. MCSS17_008]PZF56267.1 hypothetical protein DEJ23_10360 [Curtobacterium sp. MCSS17_008]